MPRFILIHRTVWPQYTNVTDTHNRTRQTDRTDNGPIQQVDRFTNGRPKTVCAMLYDRRPASPVLFMTLVYYGQDVGWIKLKLGRKLGVPL